MKSSRKWLRVVLLATAVVIVGIQLVPVDRSNPTVTATVTAPPEVLRILERSCYDCHSHETRWPWYGYVAPVSWLVAKDVREGRDHLNFSTWDRYGPHDQAGHLEEIAEETAEGEMPLSIYLVMHPDAALSADDLSILADWAGKAATADSHAEGAEDD